jgi:aryl-phospho-beta-D-glucosidase BglC (GH1 family)
MFQKFWKQSLVVLILLATTSVAGPVAYHGALSTTGNKIYGSNHAQPVQLRGMSLFWSQWEGEWWNSNTIGHLRTAWKSDLVRAAMGVSELGTGYLHTPTDEKARVAAVVNAAVANDMYVIIDWHSHEAHNQQAAAITFFQEMATLYGSYPNVIYEIYNEPLNVNWTTQVKPYAEAVIAAIRAIDPDNLIIVGTPNWSQDVDVASLNPITAYSNIAYTLHFYANTHGQSLRDKAQTALNRGIPLFVTEWGTVNSDGNGSVNSVESANWMSFLDLNKISWANWSLSNKAESSAALKSSVTAQSGWSYNNDLTVSGQWVYNELIAKQQDYSGAPSSSSSVVASSSSSAPISTKMLEGFNYERIDMVALGATEPTLGYWYSYIDGFGSVMTPSDSAEIATGFDGILNVTMTLVPTVAPTQYPFAGVGFDFINNGALPDASKATVNLSSWSGISITYSATNAVILEMGEARQPDGSEYYCTLPGTIGVQTVTCLWTDFAQPAWAATNVPPLTRTKPTAVLTGLKFAYKTGSSSNSFALHQMDMVGSGLGTFIADAAPVEPSSSSSVVSSSSSPVSSSVALSSSSVPASSSSQAISSSVVVSSSSTPISSSVAVSSSSAPLSSSSQALSSSSVVLATGYLEGFDYERIDFIAPGLIEDQIGYWYTYIDTYGSTMSPNDSASVAANFGDLSGALEITISLAPEVPASLQYPFAGVGFDFANNGALSDPFKTTVDLTSWSGIAVTYSAINPVIVEMGEARTADGAEYNCILPSTFGVVQTQQCLWTVFAQPAWAATAVPPLTRAKPTAALTGFKFAYKTGSSSQTLRLYQLDLLGSGLGISIADAPPVVVPPSSSSAVVSSSSVALSSSVVVSSSSVPLSSSVVVSSSSTPLSSSVVVSSSSTPLSSSVVVSSSSSPLSSSSQALSSSVPQSSSSAPVIIGGTIEGFNTNRVDFVAPGVLAENRGYWYTYVDAFGSLISPNGETELIGAFDGTLDMGMLLAAQVPALNQYPFAGVGFDFVDNGLVADPLKATVDLSSWQGISVTYASTTPLFLEMGEARTPDGAEYFCLLPATGGTVTHNCLWTAFAQPGWASGALIRPMPVSALTGFKFAYKTGNSGSNFYLESLDLIGNGLGSSVADEVEGPVISVQFAENSGFKILGFAGNSLEYILNQSGLYQIQITDLFGRILESHELNATAGIQELQLRQNYATGAYFVRLVQNSRVSSARINIQN